MLIQLYLDIFLYLYVITSVSISISLSYTYIFFFLHQKVSESFFNGMFETFDSVTLFTPLPFWKSVSVYRHLSGKCDAVCLLQDTNPLSTICTKWLASKNVLCCEFWTFVFVSLTAAWNGRNAFSASMYEARAASVWTWWRNIHIH